LKVAFPIQPVSGNLIVRYLDAIDLHRWLASGGHEYNPGAFPAGRYSQNSRQILVEAAHPRPRQLDDRQLGAELTAPQKTSPSRTFRISAKYASGSVKVRTTLEGIPYLDLLGLH